MKKTLLFLVLVCLLIFCNAQVLQDRFTGKYFFEVKNSEIEGSPYLYDDWRKARITFANGFQLMNLPFKYNQYRNKPLFQRNDSAFEFINEVWEFIIYNPGGDSVIFRNDYRGEEVIAPETYFQVLVEGNLDLLKRQVKSKTEVKGFSNATPKIVFTDIQPVYYVLKTKTIVKLKKNDDAALRSVMKKDWEKVSAFIKEKNLGLKKEEDYIAIIRYYNSL